MHQHRDSQKRYYEENSVYFIVTKTFRNFPYFKELIFCELFAEELKLCKKFPPRCSLSTEDCSGLRVCSSQSSVERLRRGGKKLKKFKLYGFCVIYDHLNLLIHPGEEFNISEIMQFLKRHCSRNANYIMNGGNENEIDFESEGDIGQCRLRIQNQFCGDEYNQFSDTIKSFDNKINDFRDQFIKKYGQNQIVIPKFKWQKSFYAHIIRNIKDFKYHYNYTVYNFLKHKLPGDWKYTSLNRGGLVEGIGL